MIIDDGEDDGADEWVCLGECRVPVVGLQYYSGIVNAHEAVMLVREPNNRYDPNAIAVHNVSGHQVRSWWASLACLGGRGL